MMHSTRVTALRWTAHGALELDVWSNAQSGTIRVGGVLLSHIQVGDLCPGSDLIMPPTPHDPLSELVAPMGHIVLHEAPSQPESFFADLACELPWVLTHHEVLVNYLVASNSLQEWLIHVSRLPAPFLRGPSRLLDLTEVLLLRHGAQWERHPPPVPLRSTPVTVRFGDSWVIGEKATWLGAAEPPWANGV